MSHHGNANGILLSLACCVLLAATQPVQAAPYDPTSAVDGSSTIGAAGDYASLYAACQDIMTQITTNGAPQANWTFTFLDAAQVEPQTCYLGANLNSKVLTFRPAEGVNVVITYTASAGDANIQIGRSVGTTNVARTDNVVFDGSWPSDPTGRHLTLTANTTRRILGVFGDSDGTVIQNITFSNSGLYLLGSGTDTPDTGAVTNCIFTVNNASRTFVYNGTTNWTVTGCTMNQTGGNRIATVNAWDGFLFKSCTYNFNNNTSNQVNCHWWNPATATVVTFDSCVITVTASGGGTLTGCDFVTLFQPSTINFTNCFLSIVGSSGASTMNNPVSILNLDSAVLGNPPAATVRFRHNSCMMRCTTASGTGGSPRFGILRVAPGTFGGAVTFRNNVVYNNWLNTDSTITSAAMIFPSNGGTLTSDENFIWNNTTTDANNRWAIWNNVTTYTTRALWNAATGDDANSNDQTGGTVNPTNNWTSTTDFHFGGVSGEPGLLHTWWHCPVLSAVPVDIDGVHRNDLGLDTTRGAVMSSLLPVRDWRDY